jgi:hypothetical protein
MYHNVYLRMPVPQPTSMTTASLKSAGFFRIESLYASVRTCKKPTQGNKPVLNMTHILKIASELDSQHKKER